MYLLALSQGESPPVRRENQGLLRVKPRRRPLPLRETLRGSHSGLITRCIRSTPDLRKSWRLRRRRQRPPSTRFARARPVRITRPSSNGWRPSLPFVTVAVTRKMSTQSRVRPRVRGKRKRKRPRLTPLLPLRQQLEPLPPRIQAKLDPRRTEAKLRYRETPRPLAKPAGRERLHPSKLFSKSLLGSWSDRNCQATPAIRLGHHSFTTMVPIRDRSIRSEIATAHGGPEDHRKEQLTRFGGVNKWYYHSDSVVNIVDDYVRDWFHGFLIHGTVWTGSGDNSVNQSQRLAVKPLKSSDWPSNPLGPSWPSFPSIPEWMEMIRKGIDPFDRSELLQPEGYLGFTQVSRSEVSRNCFLATRIVRNVIVGIRSTTEIPGKFLKFFRYSKNFLILVNNWSLPIGLVRFLIGQWCQNPYSLWLRRAVSFKKFLKKVPISLVRQARLRLDSVTQGVTQVSDGRFTDSPESSSEFYSEGSSALD